jgi:sugar-specific transcriptional regulator TrmB
MDDFDKIIRKLALFGLGDWEAGVYLAVNLAEKPNVAEISKISKVPRTKVYGVVKRLEEKGLVQTIPEKTTRHTALPIHIFLENRISHYEERAQSLKQEKEEVLELLKKVKPRQVKSYSVRNLHILRGKRAVSEKNLEMLSSAKREILILSTDTGAVKIHQLLRNRGIYRIAKEKEARLSFLFPVNDDNKLLVKEVPDFVQVRNVESFSKSHLFIVDRQEMLMDESSNDKDPSAFWTNDVEFVNMFLKLFDVMRERAKDVPERIELANI